VKFISAIKKEAEKWAQPVSIKKVSIESSGLGTDAVLYGAAFLAINEKLSLKEIDTLQ
jgi:glucokinase